MQIERSPQMTCIAYDLNQIVRKDHELRRIEALLSFKKIAKKYKELEGTVGRRGYSLEVGIKCLFEILPMSRPELRVFKE